MLTSEEVQFHIRPAIDFLHDALGSAVALEEIGVDLLDLFDVKICRI